MNAASSDGGVSVGQASAGQNVNLQGATNVTAGTTQAGQNATFSALSGFVNAGTTSAGGSVQMTAGGDVIAGTTNAGQNVALASVTGGVSADSVTAGGGVAVGGPGDLKIGTGKAGTTFEMNSPAGDIRVDSVTADAVSLAAAGDIDATKLNVASRVDLAGTHIDAAVFGGPQVVQGSVTGYNDSVASDVNLVFSSPSGFALSSFYTALGDVNVPQGFFSFTDGLIVDRLTITNPQTTLLVDQHDRSLQPFNVQIYTGGAGFSLGLATNHVLTDAFAIQVDSGHEALSPSGPIVSAVDQSYNALRDTAKPGPEAAQEQAEQVPASELITFTGTPVSVEE